MFVVIRTPPYGPWSALEYMDGPEEIHKAIREGKDIP